MNKVSLNSCTWQHQWERLVP